MIVLRAKNIDFDVTYINLREKPDWFLKISPRGKVPVLNVEGAPLFESNAIAEYLEEMEDPKLHPADPMKRARNRAWTDYCPDFTKYLSGVYYTKTREEMEEGLEKAPEGLEMMERAIADERGNDGPYFNGDKLCLVDAAYAPFFQRFMMVDEVLKTRVMDKFPLVKAWAEAMLANPVISGSVPDNFREEFVKNLNRRGFYVATLMGETSAAAE